MRRLGLLDALAEAVEPRGRTVVDVGCGDGTVARHLTGLGARVTGIEVSDDQLARARAAAPAGDESYRVGTGEALPLEDASADAVVYSKSFHHVPPAAMAPALAEAARVLRPGGRLVVVEPIAEGACFETTRPIEDETAVRAAALDRLRAPPPELEPVEESVFLTTQHHRDADRFLAHAVAVDPARRDRLPLVEDTVRRLFTAKGRPEDGGMAFDQPMRRLVFRRRP